MQTDYQANQKEEMDQREDKAQCGKIAPLTAVRGVPLLSAFSAW